MTKQSATTPSHGKVKRAVTGVVDSVSGKKTVRVRIENLVKHPLYGKYMRRWTKVLVHDPTEQASLGDHVEVAPCRPISKTKSWRVIRVVRRAEIT